MTRNKALYWFLQFFCWGIFCIVLGLANFIKGNFSTETILHLLKLYVLLIVFSHLIRWVVNKYHWLDFSFGKLALRVSGLVLLFSFLLLLFNDILNVTLFREGFLSLAEYIVNVFMYGALFFIWTSIYYANHLLHKSREQEINNLRLDARKKEIELKTLLDQLNPHFLFNSLNSIKALVSSDPETAKYAINSLSRLLRNSMFMGKKNFVSLKEEINLIKEYLKLEKIRYEERLDYTIDNQLESGLLIPPLLIQGMVENAMKHGISKLENGGEIHILLRNKEDGCLLEVINTGKLDIKKENRGIGVENTRRRLEIIYGENAQFNINEENGLVHASVWIKQN